MLYSYQHQSVFTWHSLTAFVARHFVNLVKYSCSEAHLASAIVLAPAGNTHPYVSYILLVIWLLYTVT